MKRNLSNLLLGVVLLYGSVVHAQQDHHRYEAKLGEVTKDGFYRVALKPEITGRSYANWQDQRLLDDKRKQVPYLLEKNHQTTEITVLDFPLIVAATDTSKQHFIVIENSQQLVLDNLKLEIENTEATRSLTLSGSDDKINWYAIREDFYWEQSSNNSRTISFPAVHYLFLKLVFNGSGKLPVKVLRAKTFSAYTSTFPSYFKITRPGIKQKDSSRHSYVTLSFDRPYKIDKLALTISGPKYFHRTAHIRSESTGGNDEFITELSSGTQTISSPFIADKIFITIDNDDNPTIHIDDVNAFQDAQFLLAYLEANKTYSLTFGDSTAQAPVYDLSYFKDSIGKQIPELGVGPIQEIKPAATPQKPPVKDYKWLMWVVIGLVIAGLLFMTVKMLKQMKETPND